MLFILWRTSWRRIHFRCTWRWQIFAIRPASSAFHQAGPPIHIPWSKLSANFLCYVPHCKTGRRRRWRWRRNSKIQQHFVLFLNIQTIWRCTVNDVKATNETWSKSHKWFFLVIFLLLLLSLRLHPFTIVSPHSCYTTLILHLFPPLLAHFDRLLAMLDYNYLSQSYPFFFFKLELHLISLFFFYLFHFEKKKK